jgi:hypothetical protein
VGALAQEIEPLPSIIEDSEQLAAKDYGSVVSGTVSCLDPYDDTYFWFAGTEFTFMGVDAETGGQSNLALNDTRTPGIDVQLIDANGMEHLAYTPRVWLGRQFDDWGILIRYWRLEDSTIESPDAAPGATNAPTTLTFSDSSRVRLYSLDAEAFAIFFPGQWKIDGSFGVRHASIGVQSQLEALGVFTFDEDPMNPGTFTPASLAQIELANGFTFNGTGVTAGITARRQLWGSAATWFFSGRASYLGGRSDTFGENSTFVAVNRLSTENPGPPLGPIGAAGTLGGFNRDAELDIFEFQTGVQWDFRLRNLPVNAFFRTAFEMQNWDVDGPPIGAIGVPGVVGHVGTFNVARGGHGGVHLYGLTLGAGFNW